VVGGRGGNDTGGAMLASFTAVALCTLETLLRRAEAPGSAGLEQAVVHQEAVRGARDDVNEWLKQHSGGKVDRRILHLHYRCPRALRAATCRESHRA